MFEAMFSENELTRRSRSRLWTNRLWILSGALGTATLVSMVLVVHDTERQRAAAGMVAKAAANQAASTAAGRLEILALETFAPAAPWEARSSVSTPVALNALVHAQRGAAQCRCRDTLPADAFFQYEVKTGTLTFRRLRLRRRPRSRPSRARRPSDLVAVHGQECISTRVRRSATRVS